MAVQPRNCHPRSPLERHTLFSFKTTRDPALRFASGHFVMIGLEVDSKLMRAYSFASANYEEHLEFPNIKVQDGPLTLASAAHLKVGDKILVSRKAVGCWWWTTSNPP